MYCEICHKENPENFDLCIYCGTSLKPEKKAGYLKYRNSLWSKITPFNVFTVFISFCIIITTIFGVRVLIKKEHPEKTAFSYASSIQKNDINIYFSILFDEYKDYNLKYKYYKQENYNEDIKSQYAEIKDFYNSKCGEKFKIECKVLEISYALEKEVSDINLYCSNELKFTSNIEKAAKLKISLNASGKLGKYDTIIPDFVSLKIDGVWYYMPHSGIKELFLQVN